MILSSLGIVETNDLIRSRIYLLSWPRRWCQCQISDIVYCLAVHCTMVALTAALLRVLSVVLSDSCLGLGIFVDKVTLALIGLVVRFGRLGWWQVVCLCVPCICRWLLWCMEDWLVHIGQVFQRVQYHCIIPGHTMSTCPPSPFALMASASFSGLQRPPNTKLPRGFPVLKITLHVGASLQINPWFSNVRSFRGKTSCLVIVHAKLHTKFPFPRASKRPPSTWSKTLSSSYAFVASLFGVSDSIRMEHLLVLLGEHLFLHGHNNHGRTFILLCCSNAMNNQREGPWGPMQAILAIVQLCYSCKHGPFWSTPSSWSSTLALASALSDQ